MVYWLMLQWFMKCCVYKIWLFATSNRKRIYIDALVSTNRQILSNKKHANLIKF